MPASLTPPLNSIRNLKDIICSFGCPDDRMNEVRMLGHAIFEKQTYGTSCNTSQCSKDVCAANQGSTATTLTDFLSSSILKSALDGPGSISSWSSSDCSKRTHWEIPGCTRQVGVTAAGHSTWRECNAQRGQQALAPNQRIADLHQQPRVFDISPDKTEAITTLVIQNIPLHCTTHMLMDEISNVGFTGVYNFLYHPVDHQTKNHRSYAFVNFVTPRIATAFHLLFHGAFLNSEDEVPVCVVAAREQGISANTACFYTRKSEQRNRLRARPIRPKVDKDRVLEVEAYARQLLTILPDMPISGGDRHLCWFQ